MARVKIRMLETISGMVDGNEYPKVGDVIEVDTVVADDLCDRPEGHRVAERVKKPAKKTAKKTPPAKPKRETATKVAVETTDKK